jgi:uncharacterized damage-inducible protein DinB
MEKSHALKLLAYDYWANCRLFSAINESSKSIPAEIEDVFSHLLGAKSIWHKRIIGEEAAKDLFNRKDLRTLIENNEQLKSNWESLLEKYMTTSNVTYHNLSGEKAQSSLADILTHVVNHGSYHRGQAIRILREAGITPLANDYIVFCRQ